MLKIRLKRIGKRHEPHYRIVVAEARSKRDGRPVDALGSWNPKEEKLQLRKDEYNNWIKKGAQPTEAIRQLINK